MDRISAIAATAVVMIGLAAGGYLWFSASSENMCSPGQVAGEALIGGPFTLTDQTGARVTEADVFTEPSLVYFGYTFCPDVCPFDVSRNVEVIELLEERGVLATPVFVTIDPERDTVENLLYYSEAMHPKMIALTGSLEDIKSAADAYRVIFQKNGEGEDYLVDHSTFTYLMDENGFQGFFRRTMSVEEIADQVQCIVS
ncbi:MAG: SCO family protein [Pseudomonadota bacterium]